MKKKHQEFGNMGGTFCEHPASSAVVVILLAVLAVLLIVVLLVVLVRILVRILVCTLILVVHDKSSVYLYSRQCRINRMPQSLCFILCFEYKTHQ